MGRGTNALAIAAIMLAHSTSAHALAWRVEGSFRFYADVEERNFFGESIAEYSARVTEKDLKGYGRGDMPFDYLYPLPAKFVTAFDSINGGLSLPSDPTVFLYVEWTCESDDEASCRLISSGLLLPEAGTCWSGCVGQFEWFSVPGEGSYASLPDGTFCDFDGGCNPGDEGSFDWEYGREVMGTVELVPEPASLALLGLGLMGLGASRRRRAN